jgi:hypothetical protein
MVFPPFSQHVFGQVSVMGLGVAFETKRYEILRHVASVSVSSSGYDVMDLHDPCSAANFASPSSGRLYCCGVYDARAL